MNLLTTAQAADLAHRRPGTIRAWASTGRLQPAGRTHDGRPLYDPRDVWDVEHQAHARSRNGLARRNMNAA